MKRLVSILILFILVAPVSAACSSQGDTSGEHAYHLAPLSQMIHEVQQAPVSVREAYQFAVANPDVLQELPCYCGCGAMDHTSNYSCYVAGEDSNGAPQFDNHALGCQICVDITQDAMRLLDEGQSIDQIYDYVAATYSRFGPPTALQ